MQGVPVSCERSHMMPAAVSAAALFGGRIENCPGRELRSSEL